MKNKIILHDYFWDKVTYSIKDIDMPKLIEVFTRIARHLEYTEETITKYLTKQ